MNKQQVANLLGLAQRAGRIISGAPNLSKKIKDKSHYYQVDVSTVFSTLELSSAIGKARKVLTITDAGFTKKMRSIMQ